MPYTDHTEPNTALEYDKVAGLYNTKFDNSFDAAEEEFIFDQFRHLIRANDVLDIGCGTGLVKRLADMDLFKMRSYTGVDYSEGMIKVAKAKYPGAIFIQHDMVEFMNRVCEPGSFDTVVAMYCPLNYCEQHQAKVYAAVRRVLKQGGHFINVAASSRYAARESHVISASNMRRYFDDSPYHIDMIEEQFSVVSIHGANYSIEKYRRWLERCPKIINKRLFKFDAEQFKQSGRNPLLYTFILQKL